MKEGGINSGLVGTFLMLATVSDSLKVYDFKTSEFELVSERSSFGGRLNAVAWNHTNQVVAVAGASRIIHLVQASNGQLLSEVPFSSGAQDKAILKADTHIMSDIVSVSFSNSSRYLASSSGSSVHVWDLKKRNLRCMREVGKSLISSILFLPDGSRTISGNKAGDINVWDFETNSNITSIGSSEFTPTAITCLDISLGTQTKLASGYLDGGAAVWDPISSSLLRRQVVHQGRITSLTFSPKNSRLLATAGFDGRINLVDTASKTTSDPSASVSVGERLTSISFSTDAIHSAVGTENGRVFMFDWRNLRSPVCVVESHSPMPVVALRFQGLIRNGTGTAAAPSSAVKAPASAKKIIETTMGGGLPPQEVSSHISLASNVSDVTQYSDSLSVSTRKSEVMGLSVASGPTSATPISIRSFSKQSVAPSTSNIPSTENLSSRKNKLHTDESSPAASSSEQRTELVENTSPAISYDKQQPARYENVLTESKLQEMLDIFRYDVHKEIQSVIREQVRQFVIAKVRYHC